MISLLTINFNKLSPHEPKLDGYSVGVCGIISLGFEEFDKHEIVINWDVFVILSIHRIYERNRILICPNVYRWFSWSPLFLPWMIHLSVFGWWTHTSARCPFLFFLKIKAHFSLKKGPLNLTNPLISKINLCNNVGHNHPIVQSNPSKTSLQPKTTPRYSRPWRKCIKAKELFNGSLIAGSGAPFLFGFSNDTCPNNTAFTPAQKNSHGT